MSDINCGSCRYWKSRHDAGMRGEHDNGVCEWIVRRERNSPVPYWICWGFTSIDDGSNCPAWKAKQ